MANEVEVTLKLNVNQAQQVIRAAENGFKQFGSTAEKSLGVADVAFGSFVGNIAAAGLEKIISGIAGSFGGLVDATKDLEAIETRFKVLTGSADEAQKVLANLQTFAAGTPFQLPGLADATAQLISFGVSTNDLEPTLRQLGDLAAGAGTQIGELTIPFGRLISTQKLTLQELDKFADRGINIFAGLAEKSGVSLGSIRDEISKGNVPFEDFIEVINEATSEGGQFFGATAELSQTLGGVLSTLGDNFFALQGAIGGTFNAALISGASVLIETLQSLVGFIQENEAALKAFSQALVGGVINGFQTLVAVAQGVVGFFANFDQVITRNKSNIEAAGIAVAALGTALLIQNAGLIASAVAANAAGAALVVYNGAVAIARTGTAIFNAILNLNPIVLLVTGLGLAAAAFVKFNGGIDGAIGKLKEWTGAVLQFFQPGIEVILQGVAKVAGIFDKDLADSARTAIAEIAEFSKQLEESGKKQNEVALAAENSAQKIVEAEAVKREAVAETNAQADENKNKAISNAQEVADFETLLADAKKERQAEEFELDRERAEIKKGTELEELASLIGERDALETQAEVEKLQRQGKNAEAEKLIKDKLAKADEQRLFAVQKFEDKTNKQKIDGLKSTLGTVSSLQSSNNKTLFRIGQAGAIANATISGFEGFARALGAAPPPFNFILAGLVAAASAANIAKIASSSPPSFQFGGIVPGQPSNADNQIITAASGEAVLNRQQQAELFNQLNTGGGEGSGNTININVESSTGDIPDENVDNIVDNINNRTEFGNVQVNTGA